MTALLHQVFSVLAIGGIYASVALALVMIYQATHLVNFAQGEMAMFSTYIASSLIGWGLPYWVAFGLTLAISFAGGLAIQRIVVRPVQDAPVLSVVIVFIGLLVIINSMAGAIYSYTITPFPSPFPSNAWYGNSFISPHEAGSIMVTMGVLALVYAFFRFTPLGLAVRAVAQNPVSSRLAGIPAGLIHAFGPGLAAASGAAAGLRRAPTF